MSAHDQSAGCTVRRAELTDASHIAALSEALGYPVIVAALADRLGRLLARTEHLVLVAEAVPGEVSGWVHASDEESLETERRCEILGLIVAEQHRARGVGRRLVAAVEEWARERGIDEVAVRSNIARAESHPFYERLGYHRVKTQHAYRKRLRDGSGSIC